MRAETGVSQFECRACGFRYFDPALAGHGIFYAELERNGYYVENRTEFEFALKLCQSAGAYSVLDSDGHFSSQRDLSCCARSENHEPRDY